MQQKQSSNKEIKRYIEIDSSDNTSFFNNKRKQSNDKINIKLSNGNPFLNKMLVSNPFARSVHSTTVSLNSQNNKQNILNNMRGKINDNLT